MIDFNLPLWVFRHILAGYVLAHVLIYMQDWSGEVTAPHLWHG